MAPRIDILSLFPEVFPAALSSSILGRAVGDGLLTVHVHDIRQWAEGPHRKVDDRPFGGGPGMVFMCEPLAAAVEAVEALDSRRARRVLLAPAGRPLTQRLVNEVASAPRLMLLCGHYEGVDQRAIDALGFEEISVGDFVVSGGELPALLLVDAIARLLPGALGHEASAAEDSFSITNEQGQPLLDCPHYTRPRVWRERAVPEVLLSGDHQAIAEWRRSESELRTRTRRPDLVSLHGQPLEDEASMLQRSTGLNATAPRRTAPCCASHMSASTSSSQRN